MKKLILVLIYITVCHMVFAQEKVQISILKADSTWAKEIIKFPIDWASDMTLTGFEEICFHKNWSDKDSDAFWSIVLAWSVKADSPLTINDIESNFDAYFNGLMKPNHWSIDFPDPNVLFTKIETEDKNEAFQGKMTLFDGFHTGKVIDINILAQQYFCKVKKTSIVVFRLSPQNTDHTIWKTLNTVELKSDVCEI